MQKMLAGVLIVVAGLFMLSAPNVLAQDFCQGDFNYDGDVDGGDVEIFLEHFGRSQYFNPCPPDGPAPVAKTGQTIFYATGGDGDLERGVALVAPRFTDNLDGTVTDNQTGLIWLKEANCFGERLWHDALADCNGLSAGWCGLTDDSIAGDWRLPNLRELQSKIDYGQFDPALTPEHPFGDVLFVKYWASTTAGGITVYAWTVEIRNGIVERSFKTDNHYVWPVRGGH